MIPEIDVKMTPLRSPNDPTNLCLLLVLKWMKDDRTGRRIKRKIERGKRFGRENGRMEYDEHKDKKVTKERFIQ